MADLPIPNRVSVIEQLPGHLDQFVIGMVAAYVFVAMRFRLQNLPETLLNLIFFAGMASIGVMCAWINAKVEAYWEGSALLIFWHTATSIAIALILFVLSWQTTLTKKLFGHRVFYYLGDISFGIYLWHLPLLTWLLPLFEEISNPEIRFLSGFSTALACTLMIAHFSYQWIERPSMNFKRRFRAIFA